MSICYEEWSILLVEFPNHTYRTKGLGQVRVYDISLRTPQKDVSAIEKSPAVDFNTVLGGGVVE